MTPDGIVFTGIIINKIFSQACGLCQAFRWLQNCDALILCNSVLRPILIRLKMVGSLSPQKNEVCTLCDQMARLFVQFWAVFTSETLPKSIIVCKNMLKFAEN